MSKKMQHLVISVIAQDRSGIVNDLSEVVASCECNIEDSRMVVLGGSFAIIMMVVGDEQNITKLMSKKDSLVSDKGLSINMSLTDSKGETEAALPYYIEVVSLDHQGIIRELSEFIASRKINIAELHTETYAAPHTGSTMFKLHMTVNIPASIRIAGFRDELVDFCDLQNLDISFEPCTF